MSPERQPKAAVPGMSSPAPPWQFLIRAAAVITGLTLLLIVDVAASRSTSPGR